MGSKWVTWGGILVAIGSFAVTEIVNNATSLHLSPGLMTGFSLVGAVIAGLGKALGETSK